MAHIPPKEIPRKYGLTGRAIVLGLFLAIVINIWVPYGSFLVQSSRMTMGHLPIAVMIPFFILLLIVNPLLRYWRPSWRLSSGELVLVFVMMFIASLVPGKVMVAYLIGVIATPYYFARPENQWAMTFHEYLPDWLLVSGQGTTLVWFYEGMPDGTKDIIWGPWLPPLFWWLTLFVVLFFNGRVHEHHHAADLGVTRATRLSAGSNGHRSDPTG